MRVGQSGIVTFTQPWGRFAPGVKVRGTVQKIFRARSGAVLAVIEGEQGKATVPVSKYIKWDPFGY